MMLCLFPDICLQPGTIGGIEADSFVSDDPLDPLDTVDRGCNGTGVPEKVATRTLPSGSCAFSFCFGGSKRQRSNDVNGFPFFAVIEMGFYYID